MQYKFLILFIWKLLFAISFFSQDKSVSDRAISEADSVHLAELKSIVSVSINPNPDTAFFYIKKLETYVKDLDYPKGLIDADYLYACYYRRVQNSDSSIHYFKSTLNKSNRIDYDPGKALAYKGLCHVYSKIGEMDLAFSSCKSCIELAKKNKSPDVEAATYLAIGQIHMRQNELKKALLFNLKIDSMNQVAPVRGEILAGAYLNIGEVYLGLDDYDNSEKYFKKGITQFESMPQDVSYYLKHANWYLGQLNYKKGNFTKARSLLEDCHVYFSKIQDNHTLAELSKTLGLIYIELGLEKEGSQILQQAYDIHFEFGNRNEMAYIGIELGKLYINQNETNNAIEILSTTLADVPRLNNSEILQEAHVELGEAYSQIGDFDNAYYHIKKGSEIKDSLQLIQSAGHIRELETRYQSEQKEREIVFLKSQNELSEQQKKNQRNLLLGGIGATTLTSLFFFFLYRNRQETNRKLHEIDQAKSTFFTNISHEFRTPLTLIKGPIQEQLNRNDLATESRTKFEMIDRNADRLLNLVDQTLKISKIESGGVFLKVSENTLGNFVATLADAFSFIATEKNITYAKNIESTDERSWFDHDAIEKIVTNLLSNAFKYTPENGNVIINANVSNGLCSVEVKNDGPGIGKEEIKKIFDRFYQVSSSNDGVGVGLSLVKDLVELHKGEIDVKSDQEGWTVFSFSIPVVKNAYLSSETIESNLHGSDKVIIEGEVLADNDGWDASNSKPIMLIVEDNNDVRAFVKSLFAMDYQILEAENGEIGIRKAIKSVPDIILSDVMMPIVDGIELSNTLKNNQCTSHIPIILLTAKVGDENELEGVKSGADDYITKPFNVELIKTKINNLLEIRRKLRERYSNDLFVNPKDISVTTADEELLTKIQQILEEKIGDGNFSVEEFSSMVGMSRMQLHRKLKAITGLSASEFIRSQRIKQAAFLLQSTDKNVSEIGYSVGFNDHAYFSKCFKEVFEMSPTEYVASKI